MGRHDPSLWMSSQLEALVRHAMSRNFGRCAATDTWSPAVNVYELPGQLQVCVDLAGVSREQLDVSVDRGRICIRGVREAPEPREQQSGPMRILGMEIDYGPFSRDIAIPQDVVLDRVQSKYTQGLLWITLPRRHRETGHYPQDTPQGKRIER